VFKVTVNEIKTSVSPELNDDFFDDLGLDGVKSERDLEKYITENIKARKETETENKYVDSLLAEAGKNVKVEIPNAMIKEEVDRMLNQYEENLKMQGLTLALFYQFTNSNEEALREQMNEEAHSRVLSRLMLEAIAKKEAFKVTDKEVDEEVISLSAKYQMKTDEFLKSFGGKEMVKYDIEMRKAIEILKEA
jgi:trigger factor